MGEAKRKLERREAHARKIVAAFEDWIISILNDRQFDDVGYSLSRTEFKEELIKLLTTPPPKE